MAEAQGLSRTILQAPDILGEQIQLEQLKNKGQEKPISSVPNFDAVDNLGQLPPEFKTADRKMSQALIGYINDNAQDLNAGDPQKTANLSRFLNDYNIFKQQAKQASETFNDDIEGLPEERRMELGYANALMDMEDFGENLKIDDNLQMVYQTPEGDKSIFDTPVVLNPRSYYYKDVNWFDESTKGAKATLSSIENDSKTITQADRGKIKSQIKNNINLNLKGDPDAIANMTLDYAMEELGTSLSPQALNDIISGGGVEASVQGGGTKLVKLQDVIDWGTNRATEQVINETGYTYREDEPKGDRGKREPTKLRTQVVQKRVLAGDNFGLAEDEKIVADGRFTEQKGVINIGGYAKVTPPVNKVKFFFSDKGSKEYEADVVNYKVLDNGDVAVKMRYKGINSDDETVTKMTQEVFKKGSEMYESLNASLLDNGYETTEETFKRTGLADIPKTRIERSGVDENSKTESQPMPTDDEIKPIGPTPPPNEEDVEIDYTEL